MYTDRVTVWCVMCEHRATVSEIGMKDSGLASAGFAKESRDLASGCH